jgi:hypothetical protein
MPYIAPRHRLELDPRIDELARGIVQEAAKCDHDAAFAGLLNYACTRLALKVARQRFGPLRYWLIALLTGVFKNVADEFYRRLGQPYEDQQRARSGDVDLYAEYLPELKQP